MHTLGRLLSFVVVGLLAFAGTALAQGKAELQWFSQAGFKLPTPGGKVIMIDPWIKGAAKLPDEFKDLSKLGKVDLILVTATAIISAPPWRSPGPTTCRCGRRPASTRRS